MKPLFSIGTDTAFSSIKPRRRVFTLGEDKCEINLNYEFKTTESKWSRCWEVEMCDGSGTGRVKGTGSETTMQIRRHFVWQATTPLCIYAKPGKTLCTQPCCQSTVMPERWHPMDDPCLQWGYWARLHTSLGQTHKQQQKLSHVTHIASLGSNVAGG